MELWAKLFCRDFSPHPQAAGEQTPTANKTGGIFQMYRALKTV
jgi:hypothetical protein